MAAELRMRIMFEQPETERIRQKRLAELDAETQERRAAQRERDTWERERLCDAVRNPPPAGVERPPGPDQNTTPPGDVDTPDAGPDHER